MFIRPDTKQAVVLDHNLAFDSGFDIANNRQLHLARNSWSMADLVARDAYEHQMEDAMAQIQGAEGYLPEAWIDASPLTVALAAGRLTKFRDEEFWRILS